MKTSTLFQLLLIFSFSIVDAQVGIGKTNPQNILDINTQANNLDGILLDDVLFDAQLFTNNQSNAFILGNTALNGTIELNFNFANRFLFNNRSFLPSVNATNNQVNNAIDIGRFNKHFRRVYTRAIHTNDDSANGGLGINIGSGGGTATDYNFTDFAFYPVVSSSRDLGRNGNFWNNLYFTNAFTPSDVTLKENIVKNKYGLETILAIKTYNYSYKSDPLKSIHYGVIAQELQNILPALVAKKEKETDKLAVNYLELIPVLIKSIQEQNEKINELEAKISNLTD